jgi:hypothetical protein
MMITVQHELMLMLRCRLLEHVHMTVWIKDVYTFVKRLHDWEACDRDFQIQI